MAASVAKIAATGVREAAQEAVPEVVPAVAVEAAAHVEDPVDLEDAEDSEMTDHVVVAAAAVEVLTDLTAVDVEAAEDSAAAEVEVEGQ